MRWISAPCGSPVALVAGLAVAGLLAGCAQETARAPAQGGESQPATVEAPAPQAPPQPNAEGFAPIGKDEAGCVMYRQVGPEDGSGVAAIFWRDIEGGYTIDRDRADCASPSMV